jgi:peptide/nickel transport system substrate-binding protein
MRRVLLAAACALLLLPSSRQSAAAQGTLTIALREDADILDPDLGQTYVGRIVFAGLCDKLVDINEKLQIVPQLATSWDYADPKTLVMHLRPGVAFQDGEPFDAAAAKYSLMRALTLPGSFRRSEISAMDHVDVVDPHTIKIVLRQPSSPFLAQLADRAGMMVAPKAAEAEGKNFGLKPVCAGPFRFAERVPEDHITLERFPDYWDKSAIHFDKVVYRVITDSSSRLANLKAGAVDLVEYIVPSDAAAVKADPKLSLVTSDNLGYEGITINVGNGARSKTPIGEDRRIRKALELSIDRQALINVVYNGMFTPNAQAVPQASPFYDAALKPPPRDIARAKALLKEAGVKLPLTVTMTVPNSPDLLQAAEVIQSMAKDAGFDIKISAMEFASSLAAEVRGDFETYLIGWSGRVDEDGNVYAFLHTDGTFNQGHYSNAQVDNLLDQARAQNDVAQRGAIYAKMWDQVAQDDPIIYLWTPRNIVGLTKTLHGFRPVSDGMIRLQDLSRNQ